MPSLAVSRITDEQERVKRLTGLTAPASPWPLAEKSLAPLGASAPIILDSIKAADSPPLLPSSDHKSKLRSPISCTA